MSRRWGFDWASILAHAARNAWGYAAHVVTEREILIIKAPSQAPDGATFKHVVGEEHGEYADAQWARFQKESM